MQPKSADSSGDSVGRKTKTWSVWRILLAAVTAVALCFVAAYAIGYWRQASALNAEIAAIRARGEPVRFAELAPLPGDENLAGGDRLLIALERLKPLDHELIVALQGETLPEVADFSPFLPGLGANRDQLDEIIQICREGDCRFHYDFVGSIPFEILLPGVDKINDVRYLIVADVLRLLAAGECDLAAARICDFLLMASVLRHDPFYVSQLARFRHEETALSLLERLLAAYGVSPEQLDAIDQRLQAAEASCRLGPTVRGERAATMSNIECLGRPEMGELLDSLETLTPDGQGRKIVSSAYWKNRWWGSWLYAPFRMKEQTFMLGQLGRSAEIVDEAGPEATLKLAEASLKFRLMHKQYPICSIFMTDLTQVRDQALAHRQRLIAARLAIQAIRYRSQHGSLPETLDELAAAAKVSTAGLRTGKPLNYDVSEGGFAIYDQGELDVPWGRFAVEPRNNEAPAGGSTPD
ncbi:MAG TPA: hypothetical protein VHB99_09215 [Pirellulales bacterium]|nr:hypothetical protein [Pirellulales bacterium]